MKLYDHVSLVVSVSIITYVTRKNNDKLETVIASTGQLVNCIITLCFNTDIQTRKSTNRRPDPVASAKRLHRELPYSAKVRYSRDPVGFIGRHKHVHNVAQTQTAQH